MRLLLRLFEGLASLRLAVLVIGFSAAVLGWATVVESRCGTEAVHFAVYRSWWFAGLMGLLGLNVFCAAMIRFPWKKHQTGFVITHAGIISLLVGCLVSSIGGIEALLWIFEEGTGRLAFKDTQHFELKVHRQSSAHRQEEQPASETIRVPFVTGPFNWIEYRELSWFPWRLASRDQGVLYDRNGIRLELLDYYSDSDVEPGSPLELRVRGQSDEWTSIRLEGPGLQDPRTPHGPMGAGGRRRLPGDAWVVFLSADSRVETDAFRNSSPEGPLGNLGQVVLYADGKTHRLAVEALRNEKVQPLGNSAVEVEFVGFEPALSRLELLIHHWDATQHRMVLYADIPEFNRQDKEYGVYGTYWFDATEAAQASEEQPEGLPDLRKLRRPRIDVLQGADQKLYYRTWSPPDRCTIAALPVDGARVVALDETAAPVTLYVERFLPDDRPGRRIKPGKFDKDKTIHRKVRQARVRLTVDGSTEEFWLEGMPAHVALSQPRPAQRKVVVGDRRRVAVTLPFDRLDLGFQLYLHKFQRKLDPGTSMPSHYSSLVDQIVLDANGSQTQRQENVLITLNEPADFLDPGTGRSYRVFQSTFDGPYKPGHPWFDQRVGGTGSRDELFLSGLSVNYDPGRGLKYFGCLLIVAGIATMFYMRAYFFRKRPERVDDGS